MYERYTERARQVIVLAQDEARVLKHNYISTDHLLLGLLREEHGYAARVLESFDISIEEVRGQVVEMHGRGGEVTTGQIPFTPRAKKVMELALREALSLGHNYIGTEHLLLGLIRDEFNLLVRLYDAEQLRAATLKQLSTPGKPTPKRETKRERTARYAEGFERLRAWAMDETHFVQSVRMHEPTYKNPGELRKDVRKLLSLLDAEAALEAK